MIYVLGSIYNEIEIELEKIPKRGERTVADTCMIGLGGKGANQAAAIAKLGNRKDIDKPAVKLIARIGSDAVGTALLSELKDYGVNTEFVRQVKRNTGMRITTYSKKDVRTIVYNGANSGISKTDVDEALEGATSADTLLCQLEVPLYVVMYALRKARMIGMTTILNPSPAVKLPDDLYYNIDIIVPNTDEARTLTGVTPSDFSSQVSAMRYFHARGVQYAAITLGEKGATISDGAYIVSHVPAHEVNVVDRTGAGDAFVGALALTYPHVGMYSFEEACGFANKAAGLTASRPGAAESMPSAEEVYALYNKEIK